MIVEWIIKVAILLPLVAIALIALSLPFIAIRSIFVRRREREASRSRAQQAQEKILADGIVEGPKGPYVKHRRWGARTPSETEGAIGTVSHIPHR